jgi:YaiO family outer membrane protein
VKRALLGLALGAALAATASAQPAAMQVEVGASVEHLDNGSADWRQLDLALRHRSAPDRVNEIGLRRVERYGQRDAELSAGVSLPLNADWGLAVRASVSDGAFLARLAGHVDLTRRLPDGWVLGAGLGRGRYEPAGGIASGTTTLRGSVERYFGAWRLAAGVSRARLDGGHGATALRLQADRFFGDSARVGLIVARGNELEYDPQGVLSSRVGAVALVGRWSFAPGWALVGDLGRTTVSDVERRGGPGGAAPGYRRSGGRLALQREF